MADRERSSIRLRICPIRFSFMLGAGLRRKNFSILCILAVLVLIQVFFVTRILVKRNNRGKTTSSNEKNRLSLITLQASIKINTTYDFKRLNVKSTSIKGKNKTANGIAAVQANETEQSLEDSTVTNSTMTPTLDYRILQSYYPYVNFSVVLPHVEPRFSQKEIFLLILINSGTPREPHAERRKTIRQTWANFKMSNVPSYSSLNHGFPFKAVLTHGFKLVFLLGKSGNETLDEDIEQEAKKYNDIVVGNFADTYNNLILKVFMGFKWAQKSNCKYVLKGDDDTYVYLPRLMSLLDRVPNRFFGGYVVINGYVRRNTKDKHAISKLYYNAPFYPPYCEGAFYVFSFTLLAEFLRLTARFRPFHIEDAYLGILLRDMRVRPLLLPGFHISNRMASDIYRFKPCDWATFIALGHSLNPSDIEYTHTQFLTYDPAKLTALQWKSCGREIHHLAVSDTLLPALYGILISLVLIVIYVVVMFLPNDVKVPVPLKNAQQQYYPHVYR